MIPTPLSHAFHVFCPFVVVGVLAQPALLTLDLPGLATLPFVTEVLPRPVMPLWEERLFAMATDPLLYFLTHLPPKHPIARMKRGLGRGEFRAAVHL
jgi:hypothetical protein